jgi:CDP-diacylglycerol--serine O-phosphatidyltransferase
MVTATAGGLMVSRFSYPSFKNFDLTRPISLAGLVAVAIVFAVLASDPPRAFLVCFGCYAGFPPLAWVWRRLRRTLRSNPKPSSRP